MSTTTSQEVLDFWFGTPGSPEYGNPREIWFKKDDGFDDQIRGSFLAATDQALDGGFIEWENDLHDCLALIILLDQFPRNLFRGSDRSFVGDVRSRKAAETAIAAGAGETFFLHQQLFTYLPFVHSENLLDQERALELMNSLPDNDFKKNCIDSAVRHHEIIARFGRFPHRNDVMDRASTEEEIEFLKGPNSSF
ncbi:MAG: DUF924 domain-containing protein [Alphaproteobacteria bacterium]|jgi:uncharacterized protein (DUF924 family)|nr:DUF924 domain-containing protein [Alphaproteobacteria bacterium]MBT4086566.1 DUF924 domain-containing protein [Alphaproteobacteria bacterium]MBT4543126.1 DUF924 domain-containing protein [Alphaproteobacteria bacterium]MBT7745318.1 DUF924 domain-containing protein [Alphaproteobacteria bacterium]